MLDISAYFIYNIYRMIARHMIPHDMSRRNKQKEGTNMHTNNEKLAIIPDMDAYLGRSGIARDIRMDEDGRATMGGCFRIDEHNDISEARLGKYDIMMRRPYDERTCYISTEHPASFAFETVTLSVPILIDMDGSSSRGTGIIKFPLSDHWTEPGVPATATAIAQKNTAEKIRSGEAKIDPDDGMMLKINLRSVMTANFNFNRADPKSAACVPSGMIMRHGSLQENSSSAVTPERAAKALTLALGAKRAMRGAEACDYSDESIQWAARAFSDAYNQYMTDIVTGNMNGRANNGSQIRKYGIGVTKTSSGRTYFVRSGDRDMDDIIRKAPLGLGANGLGREFNDIWQEQQRFIGSHEARELCSMLSVTTNPAIMLVSEEQGREIGLIDCEIVTTIRDVPPEDMARTIQIAGMIPETKCKDLSREDGDTMRKADMAELYDIANSKDYIDICAKNTDAVKETERMTKELMNGFMRICDNNAKSAKSASTRHVGNEALRKLREAAAEIEDGYHDRDYSIQGPE